MFDEHVRIMQDMERRRRLTGGIVTDLSRELMDRQLSQKIAITESPARILEIQRGMLALDLHSRVSGIDPFSGRSALDLQKIEEQRRAFERMEPVLQIMRRRQEAMDRLRESIHPPLWLRRADEV